MTLPPRKRRWWLLIPAGLVAIMLLLALASLLLAWWRPGEPVHQGRPVSAWAQDLAAGDPAVRSNAVAVIPEFPPEARDVYALIRRGGPFRYDRDGVVFGNREGLLPTKPRGYYHEYTVSTPGTKSRGAKRIVCGGPERAPDACYYTEDHYQSFLRIRE